MTGSSSSISKSRSGSSGSRSCSSSGSRSCSSPSLEVDLVAVAVVGLEVGLVVHDARREAGVRGVGLQGLLVLLVLLPALEPDAGLAERDRRAGDEDGFQRPAVDRHAGQVLRRRDGDRPREGSEDKGGDDGHRAVWCDVHRASSLWCLGAWAAKVPGTGIEPV
jgi:hypothetical protein